MTVDQYSMEPYNFTGDDEQPFHCPYCGSRTEILEELDEYQIHACHDCRTKLKVFEPEPEPTPGPTNRFGR